MTKAERRFSFYLDLDGYDVLNGIMAPIATAEKGYRWTLQWPSASGFLCSGGCPFNEVN